MANRAFDELYDPVNQTMSSDDATGLAWSLIERSGQVQVSEVFALIIEEQSRIKDQESHEVSHNVSHSVPLVTCHSSLVTIDRGSIDVKGKGSMQTYWLEGSAS